MSLSEGNSISDNYVNNEDFPDEVSPITAISGRLIHFERSYL